MQWLQTLGPCLHDHNELTMEFQWQGKQVTLVSSPMIYTRQVTYSQMNVLVQGGQISGIFALKVVGGIENSDLVALQEIEKLEQSLPPEEQGLLLSAKSIPPFLNDLHLAQNH